jgi:hypothetical protein
MVVMPNPTMVTVVPSIVATAVSELVYVKAPVLLDIGGTRANGAAPIIFAGISSLVIAGVAWLTVIVVVIV